jgi:G3E family GTPase
MEEILTQSQLPGRIARIQNEDGTPETLDAGAATREQDFFPMLNGCFGCSNRAEFVALLEQLKSSKDYDWLLIDPLGFVAGHEVPAVLRSVGIDPYVIALLDVENLEFNDVLGIVPGQLKAANVGVGLTKYPPQIETVEDVLLEPVLDYAGRHAPGSHVFLIPRHKALPDHILSDLLGGMPGQVHVHDEHCQHDHHDHHRDHGHAHHHHHDHDFITYSLVLNEGVSFEIVRSHFDSGPENIAKIGRVKGVAEGMKFGKVGARWEQIKPDSSRPFVTFYSRTPIETAYFADIAHPEYDQYADKDTRAILRASDVPIEKTIAAIKTLLEAFPTQAIMTPDGPITHPEILEMTNELRKRPGVPKTLEREAIRRRVKYFLQVAEVLNPKSGWWHVPGCDERNLNLAIGIGWFAYNKSADLGEEIMAMIAAVDLDAMLASGLDGVRSLNSDVRKALVFLDELDDVVKFIGDPSLDLRLALSRFGRLVSRDGRVEVIRKLYDDISTLFTCHIQQTNTI